MKLLNKNLIKAVRQPRIEFNGIDVVEVPMSELVRRVANKGKNSLNPQEVLLKDQLKNTLGNGFNPIYTIDNPGFNLDYNSEIIRRLKALGIDTEQPLFKRRLDKEQISIKKYLEDNFRKQNFLGYFDEVGTSGLYRTSDGIVLVDPTQKSSLPTLLMHERTMHGSDDLIEELGANNVYKKFVESLFPEKAKSKLEFNSETGNFEAIRPPEELIVPEPFSRNSKRWYEARATLGELIRKYYFKVRNSKPNIENFKGKNWIEEIRPEFEQYVNSIPEQQLRQDLSSLNNYGFDYVLRSKLNPNFNKELRTLLKTAPAVATIIGIGNYE